MPLEPLPPLEPSEVLARFEGGESPSSSEREERVTVRERAREIIYIYIYIHIYIYIYTCIYNLLFGVGPAFQPFEGVAFMAP